MESEINGSWLQVQPQEIPEQTDLSHDVDFRTLDVTSQHRNLRNRISCIDPKEVGQVAANIRE